MKRANLSKSLRLSDEGREEMDDELTWRLVDAEVEMSSAGSFVVISKRGRELHRIRLDATTSIFETTLGESTFVIATSLTLLHLSAHTLNDSVAWIEGLRRSLQILTSARRERCLRSVCVAALQAWTIPLASPMIIL